SEDFLIPVHLTKYVRNCKLVLIYSGNSYKQLEELFWLKLAKPHKDYFIFMFNNIEEKYQDWLNDNIRHKFYSVGNNSLVRYNSTQDFYSTTCKSYLNGRHLRVTAVSGPQFSRFKTHQNGSWIQGAGVFFEILRESSIRMNYTFS